MHTMAGIRSWVMLPLLGSAAAMLALPVAAHAQAAAKDRTAGYANLAKLPDFSGVWQPDWSQLFGAASGGRRAPAPPPTTPAATKMLEDYKAAQSTGANTQTEAANCVP